MKKNIKIYHPDGINFFGEKSLLTELAAGFSFAEGSLWHPDGYLLLSDIPANCMYEVYPDGTTQVRLQQSGGKDLQYAQLSDMTGSNGLAMDKNRNIIFCQQGNHSIAKMDAAKNITQLCSSYNGRPFNSPNDVVVKSDGAVFFTDPPYGLKDQVLIPSLFQPHAGLYRFYNNQVTLLSKDLNFVNGLCFSKDEKYLFAGSNHPDEKILYRYTLSSFGEIIHKDIFAFINADGIKMDVHNNLYAATGEGVLILSPNGEKLALIQTPAMATNIALGGCNNSVLFITTPNKVYYVEMEYNPLRKFNSNALSNNDNNPVSIQMSHAG